MDIFEKRPLRIEVATLGCKVNQAESHDLMDVLAKKGFYCGENIDNPDISIINTCAVTHVSEAKSKKEIRRAKRRGSGLIIVTGCLAEIDHELIARMPEVDIVIPQSQKEDLACFILKMLQVDELPPGPSRAYTGDGASRKRARAFIKIQDGCNRRCAYCVIPRARGRSRSMPDWKIFDDIRRALERGAGELVLCGINLAEYGSPSNGGLLGLLRKIEELEGSFRVRLSSMDAEDIDLGLLRGLRELRRICPHFHLPMQSGDDHILRRMGRGYTSGDFKRLVDTIRYLWDDPAITLDVMVGFPGEGEREHRNTLRLLEELKPSRMHIFRYSPRPGTASAHWPDDVHPREKQKRMRQLKELSRDLMEEYARRQVGCIRSLVVEELGSAPGDIQEATGITENYLRAVVRGTGLEVGETYPIMITEINGGVLAANLMRGK